MVLGYLRGAPDDLTRAATSPTLGDTRTVQARLVGVLAEGMQHVGQMAYLRGLLASPVAVYRLVDYRVCPRRRSRSRPASGIGGVLARDRGRSGSRPRA